MTVAHAHRDRMRLTPTEQRILDLLRDGLPHPRREIHGCLYDDQGALSNIKYHISNLRDKVGAQGQEIICELSGGRICYRLIPTPNPCV